MNEDYTPIYVGDTGVPFAPQFSTKNGPLNLTGATFTMVMVNVNGLPGNRHVCGNFWTIDNASQGLAHYDWQPTDVSASGSFELQITVTISGKPVHTDVKPLTILLPQ